MKGFITSDIEGLVEKNRDFRRVLCTGKNLQLVMMSLLPGEAIGEGVQESHDQFFRVEQGEGGVRIDGISSRIGTDHAVIVPASARHNLVNAGEESLRLYTLCALPANRDGLVHATEADAEASDEHFDGKTSQ